MTTVIVMGVLLAAGIPLYPLAMLLHLAGEIRRQNTLITWIRQSSEG